MSDKTIIEINGVKLEVDLRHAKKIEEYKIGDNVKVLIKKYSDTYESHSGVLVGFDAFNKLPTIVICYCEISYSIAELKFVYFNEKSTDIEICHMGEHEKTIDKRRVEEMLEISIEKKREEIEELLRKRNYLLSHFNQYFSQE